MQGDELRHDRSSVAVLTARELRGETTYQPYLDKDRKKPSVQGPKKNTCTWKVEHRVVSALLRFIASWQGIKKDVKPLTTQQSRTKKSAINLILSNHVGCPMVPSAAAVPLILSNH